MAEVKRLEYGDLLEVSAALIKCLSTNIGTELIQKMEVELTALKEVITELKRTAREANASAKASSNALAGLSAKVDKLVKNKAA